MAVRTSFRVLEPKNTRGYEPFRRRGDPSDNCRVFDHSSGAWVTAIVPEPGRADSGTMGDVGRWPAPAGSGTVDGASIHSSNGARTASDNLSMTRASADPPFVRFPTKEKNRSEREADHLA